jgi:hypothetical protein
LCKSISDPELDILLTKITHVELFSPNTILVVVILTSNPNSMQVKMPTFGGVVEVEEDHDMDNMVLMEYPPRHSLESVVLKPVPEANTHLNYV